MLQKIQPAACVCGTCAVFSAEEPLDMLLMPGLAFDKEGRRLGRGGG
jgi:5-formyltetrahydrofolate cyclo-ligase